MNSLCDHIRATAAPTTTTEEKKNSVHRAMNVCVSAEICRRITRMHPKVPLISTEIKEEEKTRRLNRRRRWRNEKRISRKKKHFLHSSRDYVLWFYWNRILVHIYKRGGLEGMWNDDVPCTVTHDIHLRTPEPIHLRRETKEVAQLYSSIRATCVCVCAVFEEGERCERWVRVLTLN